MGRTRLPRLASPEGAAAESGHSAAQRSPPPVRPSLFAGRRSLRPSALRLGRAEPGARIPEEAAAGEGAAFRARRGAQTPRRRRRTEGGVGCVGAGPRARLRLRHRAGARKGRRAGGPVRGTSGARAHPRRGDRGACARCRESDRRGLPSALASCPEPHAPRPHYLRKQEARDC